MSEEVPKVLRKSAFARFIGRTPQYVTKLRKDGRLVMQDDKRVLVRESLKLMADTRGARDDVAARWAELAGRYVPEAPAETPDAPEAAQEPASTASNRIREEKAQAELRKSKAQADREEMEAAKMRGDLIAREDVEAALRFAGAAIRSQLDVLPDQTAPIVAPVTALDEVHALLQEACRNALEGLGQVFERQRKELLKEATA